ncbi:MAG TPA: cation:proton antiporter [Candidatus Sumerlaeota bacterium]|nr:cation:proton antiporter [Candidatus Sumerlaeota bacterium]
MFPLSDPILIFTVLVLAMLVMPILSERLRLPDLVLLLLAGAVLGPNGLHVLERNTAVTLFGSIGLLYIMFLAGLEIDLHRFRRTRGRSILFGVLTFTIPQVLGSLAGHYVLGFNWVPSVLLASMFASHTLLAYPIASRLGISRTEPVAITVGATIITDTLALLVLAVIADYTRGESLGPVFWLEIGGGLAALVFFTWWGIPRLTHWFFHNVTEAGGAQFLFVLVTVCGCAWLSHFAKMEPIIGAFLAGAAFNRLIPEHSTLMNRVVFAGHTLFIPFFLISVGMLVDASALVASARGWLVAGTMVALALGSKFLAAEIMGRLAGYNTESRRVMFGLSVVQAAATLAAVLVGYDLGIFNETVLNGAIVMIAVTCPMGAWMVDRHGRNMVLREPPRIRPSAAEQRLLVPVANPEYAERLLDLAFMIRDPSVSGAIHPITVVREERNAEDLVARGEQLLAHCLSHAASADIPVSPSVRMGLNTADGIVRAARELRSTLLIAGWRGEGGMRTRFFGSLMEKLVDSCPARLCFARLVRPLNTTRRLRLLLPPLSGQRQDMDILIKDAKMLSRQIGADMILYAADRTPEELLARVDAVKPSRPLTAVEAGSMPAARARLLEEITPDDLVLIPSERRSSALWNPVLDRLAERLVLRFPEINLMLCYPALESGEEEFLPETAEADEKGFGLVPVDAEEPSLFEALRRMMETAFPDNPPLAEEARHLLWVSAKSYPVELAPETVLLHAGTDLLDRSVLIVGRGATGWKALDVKTPPRILLALLSPRTTAPEQHLKMLSDLGRRFLDGNTAARVREAQTAAGICQILFGE